MTIDSSRPLRVWEKNWEMYVYTNRWIKIEEESQSEPNRGAKSVAKKTTKTKKK